MESSIRNLRVLTGPFFRRLRSLARGIRRGINIQRARYGQPIKISSPDGLFLDGLFYPSVTQPAPCLILLHSSDPQGQRHGFYVALARFLQNQSITCLTFDLRGYQKSHHPECDRGFTMEALVGDVQAALSTLIETGQAKNDQVGLYGHSYGAGIVLPALKFEPRFTHGVIHSPPDWNSRRITAPNATQQALFHERFWRYMNLNRPVSLPVFLKLADDLDILNQISSLPEIHAQLLFVEGEAEGVSMHTYLQAVREKMHPAYEYVTIPGADHYCNSSSFGSWTAIDMGTIEFLSERIAQFLTGKSPRQNSSASKLH